MTTSHSESVAPMRAYDPQRLRRAAQLAVRRISARQFAVQGRKEARHVDLDGDPQCECEDFYYNGSTIGPCKHILAARLASGDTALIQALGEQLLRAEKNIEEFLRRSRKAERKAGKR
jgi:hypothetical protein